MTPTVSVIMCTYNAERYISEAIESILAQTYTDFEFIIWDDGSTDNTKTIVESFNDERIRYFYHENTGLGMALKLACAQAKGKYIARMDSDDICFPQRFEKQVGFLNTHEQHVLVSSSVYYIDQEGDILGRTFACSDDKVLKNILTTATTMIVHPMTMMRKQAYIKAGGYQPVKKNEDLILWSRLARYGKFHNISEPLGKYRLLPTSLDHAHNPYENIIKAFCVKIIKDQNIQLEDIEQFNNLYQYSKKDIQKSQLQYKKTKQEIIYNLLAKIIKKEYAEKLIINTKNLYYKIKLTDAKNSAN